MRNRTIIKTNEQLQNCIDTNTDVEIWFGGVLDMVSTLKSFDDEVVVFKEGKYFRNNCVLKIKGSHLKLVSRDSI